MLPLPIVPHLQELPFQKILEKLKILMLLVAVICLVTSHSAEQRKNGNRLCAVIFLPFKKAIARSLFPSFHL